MVEETVKPPGATKSGERSKILTKPLPEILDEMYDIIKAATQAASKAEEATKAARKAAETCEAGEKATGNATRAAAEAAARAEEAAKTALKASEEAVGKAEEAVKKAEEAYVATLVKKVLSSWEFITTIAIIIIGSVFAAVTISLGLNLGMFG